VVGGTTSGWTALNADLWAIRRQELAKAVAHAGAMWLTLRPYEPGPSKADGEYRAEWMVDAREGCTVIVDPVADGRQRLLSAIEQLRDSSVALIDETALTSALMSPAPCEPDLTIVLGPSTRLPPGRRLRRRPGRSRSGSAPGQPGRSAWPPPRPPGGARPLAPGR